MDETQALREDVAALQMLVRKLLGDVAELSGNARGYLTLIREEIGAVSDAALARGDDHGLAVFSSATSAISLVEEAAEDAGVTLE